MITSIPVNCSTWEWALDGECGYIKREVIGPPCLACLTDYDRVGVGIIKLLTGDSLLCQRHGSLNREWRKKRGLPPMYSLRKKADPSKRKRGELLRAKLLQALESGPGTTRQLSEQTGLRQDSTGHQLRKMWKDGKVERWLESGKLVYGMEEPEGSDDGR